MRKNVNYESALRFKHIFASVGECKGVPTFPSGIDFGSRSFINVPNLWNKRENKKPCSNWHFFRPLEKIET